VTNLRLPGQYDERLFAQAGLNLQGPYYNWNRWYLPGMGRYLELDPVALRGRFNTRYGVDWFAYAGENPLLHIDRFGLSYLEYDASTGTLTVYDGAGNLVGTCPASNNAQRGSRGPWDAGTYNYAYHTTHPNDGPNSAFGSNGNFVFSVPGCTGCGVHSGRADSCDRANRCGTDFATNGCIRTNDICTSLVMDLIDNGDPLTTLTVLK